LTLCSGFAKTGFQLIANSILTEVEIFRDLTQIIAIHQGNYQSIFGWRQPIKSIQNFYWKIGSLVGV
jgi:hypothetical protein